jgi:ketosteroid isomerase-like protein
MHKEGTGVAHPNVELVKSGYEAFAKGDAAGIRAAYADNVVWQAESVGKLSGTYHGIDEVISLLARIGEETNGTYRAEILSILSDDDQVVVLHRVTAQRGERTLDTRQVNVYHLTDEKVDAAWIAVEDGVSMDAFWS